MKISFFMYILLLFGVKYLSKWKKFSCNCFNQSHDNLLTILLDMIDKFTILLSYVWEYFVSTSNSA